MTAVQPPATDAATGPAAGRATRWGIGRVGAWGWVAGGAAAAGLLLVRDPNASGSYGFCPLQAVTGLDCPLCGGLRGSRALLEGDVVTALDHNVLLPLFLLVGVVLAVSSTRGRSLTGARGSRWMWGAVIAVTVVFGVLRNLPWFPWLGSGA